MNASELEAGPELDAAVAKAVGLDVVNEDKGDLQRIVFRKDNRDYFAAEKVVHWQPSRDLNAAFEAAEKCGLFETFMLCKFATRWILVDESHNCPFGRADSPTVAICRAILKLKGERCGSTTPN